MLKGDSATTERAVRRSFAIACILLAVTMLDAEIGAAQESPHGKIRFECKTCHTTETWKIKGAGVFDHATTGFALLGQHASLQCLACHEGLKFPKKSSNCLSCHTDVHKSELGDNCMRCHTSQSWKIPDMVQRHQSTRFPLLGRHATLACQTCHANAAQKQFAGTATDCFSCHKNDFANAQSPNHVTSGFSTDCMQCHEVTAFRWGTGFKHELTRFPLTGAHVAASCFTCHRNQVFKSTPTECASCHQAEYTSAANPNHAAAGFPTACQTCHTTTRWPGALFDHNQTQFPLTGAHRNRQCRDCHADNVFAGKPTDCVSCHRDQFNAAQNPNHVGGGFPTQCQTCHSTNAWRPAQFDHNTTQLPLTGRHASTQCQACHVNNNYQLTYTNCYQCHQANYDLPTNPRHLLPAFAHDCTPCHSTTAWLPSSFNHSTTGFPLTGRHISTPCNQCHVNNVYQNLPSTCWDCHSGDYLATTDPNHAQRNFSHDCTQCHSTNGWDGGSFDHNTTNFPLTGRHVTAQCQLCHINGNYQLVYTDCYPCHTTQFAQPQNPNHVLGNFDHNCAACHTTTAWLPSTFNHASTQFPLVGAHQTVSCTQCHANNQYQNLPHTCWDCHATAFNNTTNPNHQQGQFSHDCVQCHTQSGWQPASFNHSTTNFPLTGRHTTVQCQQCHVNGNYQLVYTNCYPCHTTQFAQPQNPNHVLGNFNHDCVPCHTTTAWLPSTFNHANTVFPLAGAHQAVSCNQCHVNNQYQNLPHTCWDCHSTDFNTTTNPNHQQGQFSHDCLQCHTQSAWQPASFNHASTNFPLTGAHTTTPCVQCHVNGNYQLTYIDCYQCHASDFAIPTNPNHVTLQFSHDCTPCHTTTAWLPSTFNHDQQYFRIYSGKHQGKWTSCTQCHPSPGQYQTFTCISCHEHRQTEMDDKHRNVTGYQYNSPACYSCHRNV